MLSSDRSSSSNQNNVLSKQQAKVSKHVKAHAQQEQLLEDDITGVRKRTEKGRGLIWLTRGRCIWAAGGLVPVACPDNTDIRLHAFLASEPPQLWQYA